MADHQLSLNRAIDEVAAQMTAGDARADFGARVLGRIPERRQLTWMWTLKPAAALALLAVATMTVQIIRTSRSDDTPQPPAIRVASAVTTGTAGDAATSVDRGQSHLPRVTPRISATEAAWYERTIPELAPIEALSINGIQPEALSIAQLEVNPLATTPLNVAPIDGKGVR
jgi:hypothetical protein